MLNVRIMIIAVFGGDSDAVDISWKRSESAGKQGRVSTMIR